MAQAEEPRQPAGMRGQAGAGAGSGDAFGLEEGARVGSGDAGRLRSPPCLVAGDVVRLVAPSGAFDEGRLAAGVAFLQAVGLRPELGSHVRARRRYFAGSDSERWADWVEALEDREARAIWAVRGGYGAARLLPQLDVGKLAHNGKWFVGFSDATALHAAWARAGWASLHGANVTTLGSWGEEARQELFAWLFGTQQVQRFAGAAWRVGRVVEGRLWGGNLTVLASLVGTGRLPSLAGAVLFVEDVGERPYRLDRCLTQLVQAGVLAGVVGVVVGQLTDCEDPREAVERYDAAEVVAQVLAEHLDVPVLGGVAVGHEPSSRPLLLGGWAILDTGAATLTVQQP